MFECAEFLDVEIAVAVRSISLYVFERANTDLSDCGTPRYYCRARIVHLPVTINETEGTRCLELIISRD
jgi:hypothetical protein